MTGQNKESPLATVFHWIPGQARYGKQRSVPSPAVRHSREGGNPVRITFLISALCCYLISAAHAGGIPTVDAGVIARQIIAYQQQLRDFETQLQQVNLNSEQLAMLNRQFSQTLKHYDDYLQQVRGLQRVISRKDWNGLFQVLRNQYGISPYSRIAQIGGSGRSGGGRSAIDAEVDKLYRVPAEADQVRHRFAAAGVDPEPWAAQAQRHRARYEAYRDQLELAGDGNRELMERYRKIGITKENFDLGDKSDLNALQTAVTTNFHIIDELQALNKIQNQRLLHTNHDYMHALSMAEAQRRAEAGRLERIANQSATPRSFRWRDLRMVGSED
ncbi:MAG: hypothetical protein OXS28_02890 [Gammaproteobacteria bacterium]|nr:hypothetical protein [Gammaproteobacteria bacterium]